MKFCMQTHRGLRHGLRLSLVQGPHLSLGRVGEHGRQVRGALVLLGEELLQLVYDAVHVSDVFVFVVLVPVEKL